MGSNAVRYKNTTVPRQNGELARLKVVKGADLGAVYVLIGEVVKIGRGEDCDVVVSDLKASRFHIQMNRTRDGWKIKDQGSANGILYAGSMIRESVLKLNDVFTLGETALQLVPSDVGTQVLMEPARSAAEVDAEMQ